MKQAQIQFSGYATLSGNFNTGLANVEITTEGELASFRATGTTFAWGGTGSHSWAHTKIGLSYGGSLAHYRRRTAFDSINQRILLGLERQLTKHMVFSLSQTAGVFSRNLVPQGLTDTVPFDPSTSFIPTTDFFDNRTLYSSTRGDFVFQKSARLSFNFNGSYFMTRRRSAALYGNDGGMVGADMQYRLTRRTTIGGQYTFGRTAFDKSDADVYVHGGAFSYSVQLTQRTEFTSFGGLMRAESKMVRVSAVDPVIAALLGIRSASQIVHSIRFSPYYGARISRAFRTGALWASTGRAITPGNGLFLSSDTTNVGGGYSYNGLRWWSFGASVDHSSSMSFLNVTGRYSTVMGGASISRRLTSSLHFTSSYSLRKYRSRDFERYNRPIQSISVGIAFSPGEMALRMW
jgi:hypothetical protein